MQLDIAYYSNKCIGIPVHVLTDVLVNYNKWKVGDILSLLLRLRSLAGGAQSTGVLLCPFVIPVLFFFGCGRFFLGMTRSMRPVSCA